jgi:recombination protein RecA
MALPSDLLERLPSQLQQNGLVRFAGGGGALQLAPRSSPEPSWQQRFEEGRLQAGGVIELASDGGVALGTSIALRACAHAQSETRRLSGTSAFCAFVDPTQSLYAPGVIATGVDLEKLLVVRPDEDSLSRVALRLVESKVFPVVVIDLMGLPGSGFSPQLGAWVRVVRRLSLALSNSARNVILLTDKNAPRSLPLPVMQRIELSRSSAKELQVNVAKDLRGTGVRKARVRWDRVRSIQRTEASKQNSAG